MVEWIIIIAMAIIITITMITIIIISIIITANFYPLGQSPVLIKTKPAQATLSQ